MVMRSLSRTMRHRWALICVVGILLAVVGIVRATQPVAHASVAAPASVHVTWGDSTALVQWAPVSGAAGYQVTLIRLRDMGIMEQFQVPASQLVADAQGIWPNEQYLVAVQAVDASGALSSTATMSATGWSEPISRATYNGFLDTENVAQGQIDTNLWDVRLGKDNPANQGGTFVNDQMHYHLEAGDLNHDQTFTSMRARVPVDWSGGRTATIHGEVDLHGDFFNWFAAVLTPTAVNGDHIIDQVDRRLGARQTPQLELFNDQNGMHLFDCPGNGAMCTEVGQPFTGMMNTSNVRDEIVWQVSSGHITVHIDGRTAFDVSAPVTFTHGYLELMAENYPGNTGGIKRPTAADVRNTASGEGGALTVWHLDNWGFDAASGTQMPQMRVGYEAGCGAPPSEEQSAVTWGLCDEVGGQYGWNAHAGSQTVHISMPSDTSNVTAAGLAFDGSMSHDGAFSFAVSLNGAAPVQFTEYSPDANGYAPGSWRLPLPAGALRPGDNTLTFMPVSGGASYFNLGNLNLEAQLAAPYVPSAAPTEPAPLGTWNGGGTTPPQGPPTPTPVPLNNTPCTVTIGGVQKTGTCTGTFTPSH